MDDIVLLNYVNSVPEITDYSTDKILRYKGHKEEALRFPYVRVNSPQNVAFMIFDIDQPFVDHGVVPPPTFIVETPETKRCHAYYWLKYPVRENVRHQRILEKVARIYRVILEADRVILSQRLLSKNPLHNRWNYVPISEEAYVLTDLYNRAKDIYRVFGLDEEVIQSSYSSNSRNCLLFDSLRKFDFETFDEYYQKALQLNPHIAALLGKNPLHKSEVISIVRSIFKFKKEKRKSQL